MVCFLFDRQQWYAFWQNNNMGFDNPPFFSPSFLLIKKGMMFLRCSVSFGSISCRYFSKWWLKIFSGGNHPPYPRILTAYPTPRVRGTPFFFHQNDRKGCKRDYLDARGHFVLRFGAIGDKPLEVGNHPLRKTRVLKANRNTILSKISKHVTPAFKPLLQNKVWFVSLTVNIWVCSSVECG